MQYSWRHRDRARYGGAHAKTHHPDHDRRADTVTVEPTESSAELPASISGYSDEAKSDMAEDNLSEADIQGVLDAAHDGRAEVEFDDGHFELEFEDIDVDITPDGMVLEADR